jgi:hypothetical protein
LPFYQGCILVNTAKSNVNSNKKKSYSLHSGKQRSPHPEYCYQKEDQVSKLMKGLFFLKCLLGKGHRIIIML